MKTQGEVEAAICDGVTRFEQEYMGRGPKDLRAHLLGDLLVVRLQGVLTAAEQHLVKALPPRQRTGPGRPGSAAGRCNRSGLAHRRSCTFSKLSRLTYRRKTPPKNQSVGDFVRRFGCVGHIDRRIALPARLPACQCLPVS